MAARRRHNVEGMLRPALSNEPLDDDVRWHPTKEALYKNVGPQVRRRRYSLGWSQSTFAAKLQIAGFDISRSGVSKIEARLSYVDDKTLLYLAEVLKIPVQELFPPRIPGNRIFDFMEKLETTHF